MREAAALLLIGFASALVPVINIEAYLGVRATVASLESLWLLAFVAAVGQMLGKLIWYYIGASALSWGWVRRMVEKPKPEDAPSNLAVIGRYILTPKVLNNLNKKQKGTGGEIQLTDAIADEIGGKDGVYGYRFNGERFDCGSKAGFLQATVSFGLSRDELRDELWGYLRELVASEKAAQ